MKNSCIYTGACVLVEPYGGAIVCDLFAVGDVIFTNAGTDSISYSDPPYPMTHKVDLSGVNNHTHPTKHIVAPRSSWSTLGNGEVIP